MSNTSNRQNQDELLQHIAAIHEHKPGHRKDLSIEAMTEDLDHITGSPSHVSGANGTPIDIGTCITQASSASASHLDCVRSGNPVGASSTVAGVAGSQQDG
jgi:hypothetical protein